MNKKAVYWTIGIIAIGALGGVTYLFYANQKRKAENELLKKQVDELTEQYDVFN